MGLLVANVSTNVENGDDIGRQTMRGIMMRRQIESQLKLRICKVLKLKIALALMKRTSRSDIKCESGTLRGVSRLIR